MCIIDVKLLSEKLKEKEDRVVDNIHDFTILGAGAISRINAS